MEIRWNIYIKGVDNKGVIDWVSDRVGDWVSDQVVNQVNMQVS